MEDRVFLMHFYLLMVTKLSQLILMKSSINATSLLTFILNAGRARRRNWYHVFDSGNRHMNSIGRSINLVLQSFNVSVVVWNFLSNLREWSPTAYEGMFAFILL